MKLEQIIAAGNRGYHTDHGDSRVTCADGFHVSVIAGGGDYCTPRPTLCTDGRFGESCPRGAEPGMSDVECTYPGPYEAVEVGFPTARPEPWAEWGEFFEDWGDTKPTRGVYGYVPVKLVRDLIALHGGEVA